MNLYQKFKFLQEYKQTIKQYDPVLNKEFNLRMDWIYRCYTILNFEDIQENIRKYGYNYLDNEVRKYIRKVQDFFQEIGLLELVGYSTIDQLDSNNVLIVFEFKHLNTKKIFLWKIIAAILLILGIIIAGIILI